MVSSILASVSVGPQVQLTRVSSASSPLLADRSRHQGLAPGASERTVRPRQGCVPCQGLANEQFPTTRSSTDLLLQLEERAQCPG